ncbi:MULTISPECIES: hypothetical protein [Streptomyces]|uniref:hypothetical protein n=1 Tax=Streptomyces TaxID=1883 RepID=UPI00093E649D|nr:MULTISPECIES: hypothetical protein [unclassified Streptomyces]OKJ14392.1 hypothetical protein AMK20_00725 [Streptomyces sp. TSRI0261]QNQ35423.1 hypothetical protein HYC88_18085 [Streptomyces sp. CB00271]
MRRQTFGSTGRRGTAIAASAAALCLGGGLLAACGSGPGDDGYVAVGAAADGGDRSAGGDGKPSGKVTLVPLDGNDSGSGERGPGGRGSGNPSSAPPSPGASEPGRAQDGPGGARTETPGGQGGGSPDGPGAKPSNPAEPGGGSGRPPSTGGPGTPSPPGDGTAGVPGTPEPPAPPATPAALTLSAPQRAAADKRWCEKVTVEFRNTGGSPARSGTVTFATHIIGALGVDWATITSSQPLPAPIGAGSARSETYTVCVESWRVPLGMHIETQDVSAVWK